MKITGLRVDGYGVLANFEIKDLPSGLSVIHGPNEAGKSTLLDFLRGVLFGFPDRRRRESPHEPLRGGRHGGTLTLQDDRGESWLLERYQDARRPVLTAPDGSLADEGRLHELLGGSDETLFRSVFAFGLGELSTFETLERDEVRELVFAAGILGAGRSATRAARALETRRSAIIRPRKDEATANKLRLQHDELVARLRTARLNAEGYPAAAAESLRCAEEVRAIRQVADEKHRRANELVRLEGCWPTWRHLEESRAALTEVGAPNELFEHDGQLTLGITRLTTDLSGHLERQRSVTALSGQRSTIAHKLEAILVDLGRRDDLVGVQQIDVGFTTRERLAEIAHSERTIRAELDALAEQVSRCTEEANESTATRAGMQTTLRSEIELNAIAHDLRALRLVAQRDRLLADDASRAREIALADLARPRRHSDDKLPALVGALGLLALFGAAIAVVSHASAIAVVCLVVVLIAFAASLTLARRRLPSVAGSEASNETPEQFELAHLRAAIADAIGNLQLSERVTIVELDAVVERVEDERAERRGLDEYERADAAVQRRLSGAIARLAEKRSEAAKLVRDAKLSAAHLGLPGDVRPEVLVDAATRIAEAQQLGLARERVDTELESLSEAIAQFEGALGAACVACGIEPGENDALAVEQLQAMLADATERMQRRSELTQTISNATAQLGESLGDGPDAKRLEAELISGEVVSWEEERRQTSADLAVISLELEAHIARHAEFERALRELTSSDEIAQLELDLELVSADLDRALTEWLTLGVAHAMLDRTLARYERDRQPAVIARATDLFAQVTDGRYVRLVAREDPDNSTRHGITAISATGERVEATSLSRGTAEQLYLCLRLAFATTFAERAASLPLILDDVLVNFDPTRALAIARTINSVTDQHQVLAFTCHPHVVECFRTTADDIAIFELPGSRAEIEGIDRL